MPLWLLLTVMAQTVYRATRLVVADTFPPVLWLRDRVAGGWRPLTQPERDALAGGQRIPGTGDAPDYTGRVVASRYLVRSSWSPYWLAELVSCPWCASGWIAGAVTLATDLSVGLPDPWLVGPAVWGAASLLASRSWA
jgi:hypothetical protein